MKKLWLSASISELELNQTQNSIKPGFEGDGVYGQIFSTTGLTDENGEIPQGANCELLCS